MNKEERDRTLILPLFTTSGHCVSRAHCSTCRRTDETGVKWRQAFGEKYRLPNNDHDFVCPYGAPWDGGRHDVDPKKIERAMKGATRGAKIRKLATVAVPSIVKNFLGIGTVSSLEQAERLKICAQCPDKLAVPCVEGGRRQCCGGLLQAVNPGPGCGCVLTNLTQQRKGTCPRGHW